MVDMHLRPDQFPTVCPHCRLVNPLVTDVLHEDGEERARDPVDGDLSFCWQCGEVAVFDRTHSGGLRRPDLTEQVEISINELLKECRRAWQAIKQKGNRL